MPKDVLDRDIVGNDQDFGKLFQRARFTFGVKPDVYRHITQEVVRDWHLTPEVFERMVRDAIGCRYMRSV